MGIEEALLAPASFSTASGTTAEALRSSRGSPTIVATRVLRAPIICHARAMAIMKKTITSSAWKCTPPASLGPESIRGWFRHHVSSPEQALLNLFCFSTVDPGGGGTLLVEGSHLKGATSPSVA